jgi:hypothetical protein
MKSTKMAPTSPSIRREAQNLEVRYGKIGISAVAAAMRYQGDTTAQTEVSTDGQQNRWLEDMAPEFAA